MLLAEALILRSDLQKRILQLKQRILNNVKVQEGDSPAENATTLLAELRRDANTLLDLIQRINRTNATTIIALDDGEMSVADALARRDHLKLLQTTQRDVANQAVVKQDRFSRSEVKFVSMVDVSQLQTEADGFAKAYRELDAKIQAINWQTELI